MSVPAVVIRLDLERRPVVFTDTRDEGEQARLSDWINASPDRLRLVRLALELAEERRAA